MALVFQAQGTLQVLVYSTEMRCRASFHTVSKIQAEMKILPFCVTTHMCHEIGITTDLIVH